MKFKLTNISKTQTRDNGCEGAYLCFSIYLCVCLWVGGCVGACVGVCASMRKRERERMTD